MYALPTIGESGVEEPEELMFKVLPTKYFHMLEDTQYGQDQCKRPVGAVWAWKIIKILRLNIIDKIIPLLLVPPLMASRRSNKVLGEVLQGQVQEVEEEESPPQAQYAHSEESNVPWPGSAWQYKQCPASADYPEGQNSCVN